LGEEDDSFEHTSIVSLDESLNSGHKTLLIKLSFTKLAENFRLVGFLSVFCGSADVVKVVQEYPNGLNWLIEFLVDDKRFLVETMLLFLAHICELDTVVIVETVNVVHDAGGLRSDCCKDQQVLQIFVVSKVGVVQHNTLEQLNQLVGDISLNESLHSAGNFVNVLGFGQSSLDNLVDDFLAACVFSVENGAPKISRLSLDEVASLLSE